MSDRLYYEIVRNVQHPERRSQSVDVVRGRRAAEEIARIKNAKRSQSEIDRGVKYHAVQAPTRRWAKEILNSKSQ